MAEEHNIVISKWKNESSLSLISMGRKDLCHLTDYGACPGRKLEKL